MSKNKGSFIDRILFSTDDYDEKHHQAKAVSQSRRRRNVAIPNKKRSSLVSGLSGIKSFLTKKKNSKRSKGMKMKGGAKRKNKRSTKKRKNMRRMRRMRRTRRRRKR